MMMRNGGLAALALLFLSIVIEGPALGAQSTDPDWPCIQRKVPELSLGQIWNGPELPKSAADWQKDSDVSNLVRELSARRLPIADAQKAIREFAQSQSGDQLVARMTMVFQGLFDHMNAERSSIISGIARYTHNQIAMAARLRGEASKFAELRNKPDADANEIDAMTKQLAFETSVFEERAQSLTFVCEVPTLIEQRLYGLAKTISDTLNRE